MNLIYDQWIPVRRKSGKKEKIAPWQMTDEIFSDPIVEIAALRPDFNGALIQFLIGLLQTTCAPESRSQWRNWFNNSPLPEDLKNKFESVAHAFNLDGDGPRFMQDLTLESELKKADEPESIDRLLIDSPGEKTTKDNTDHFIKRKRIEQLCLACSAQTLLMLQLNAPAGGAGHRVGLRGGGPINTVILGNNLWGTVWNNVLDRDRFDNLATSNKNKDSDKFPWCGETRTSKQDRATTSQDIHPDQIYWSLPRRIRLIFKQDKGRCDLCDEEGIVGREYFTKPYGVMYKGVIHPLTPTYEKADKGIVEILSTHQHDAVGYKNWLGYVQTFTDGKKRVAEVINQAFDRRISNFRLWAFGYDMDKMKASCWYEGVMPVIFIEDEQKWRVYCADIEKLIRAAEAVSDYASKAVVKALNASVFNAVQQRFWQETESEFYLQIKVLRQAVLSGGDTVSARQAWHAYLVKKAFEISNGMSQADMIELVDVRRVAKAQNELCRNLYSNKLKIEILGLPR